jgi:3,4-dihydroxy 2-butanone 4-phosphate synthase / GTP cyclohydrolase II
LGSCKCDCGEQLHTALRTIEEKKRGIVIYVHQEGRGIGLEAKLRAYKLQQEGFDTVEANLALGYKDDERNFYVSSKILVGFF